MPVDGAAGEKCESEAGVAAELEFCMKDLGFFPWC
jgi:hypothetical protein